MKPLLLRYRFFLYWLTVVLLMWVLLVALIVSQPPMWLYIMLIFGYCTIVIMTFRYFDNKVQAEKVKQGER